MRTGKEGCDEGTEHERRKKNCSGRQKEGRKTNKGGLNTQMQKEGDRQADREKRSEGI